MFRIQAASRGGLPPISVGAVCIQSNIDEDLFKNKFFPYKKFEIPSIIWQCIVGSIVTVIVFYSLTYKEHQRMHDLLEKHGIEKHEH